MIDLGTVAPGSTIRIPFSSFDKDDGSSITMTNYAAADVLVYKDGSTTELASTAPITATTDFDAKTGKHLAIINLADNTSAGFFAAGSEYLVAIDAVTVDAVTTGGWIARFRIGYTGAVLDTTIATLASQTSFTLAAGPAEDDALNGCVVRIHDVASAVQSGFAVVSDYTGATKTVTLTAGTTFTAAATDNVSFFPPVNAAFWNSLVTVALPLSPTTAGRTLDVSAGGEAGVDWANVGSPTTVVDLSGTTISTAQDVDVNTIKGQAVTCAAGVTVLASVGTAATSTAQTGDSFARLGAPAGASVSADVAAVKVDTAAILVDTGTTLDARIPAALVGGKMDASVGSVAAGVDLSATMKASVNAEVLDVLNTDTFAEPAQGTPAATNTLVAKIGYLFKAWRNRTTQTATQYSLYNDDALTVDHKAATSDNGTTYERGEVATGP